MHTTHVIIAILVVLLATATFMWITKPAVVKVMPVPTQMPAKECDCSNAIDEGYDLGYIDGSNMTTFGTVDTKETFYDYENTAGKGKKTESKTAVFVKPVGGLCPKHTTEITSGKNKGKCQRTGDWYKTYRGTDEKGRTFTCQGGRVSNGKECVCDESAGKKWNGKKCVCTDGFFWDSKMKRCVKKGGWSDAMKNVKPKAGPSPKPGPSSKSCPRFQKWDGSKCVCDYAAGIMWDGKNCVCDYGRGYQWDGKNCVKKNDTRCPSGQFYDWTTARCKKP